MANPAASTDQFQNVTVEVGGNGIGRLTLNRPAVRNALSAEHLRDLADAAAWFDAQAECRVVVVSGNGRSFCAGADVSAFAQAEPSTETERPSGERRTAAGASRHVGELGRVMAEAIESMRPVTVAAVHGHCIGGGLVLAAACDLRVLADDTVLAIPEVDLGIPLAWGGLPRLVRELGPAITKELVITCRPFTAAEAQQLGFANRVVPADAVESEALELAEAVAARPRYPVEHTKRGVNAIANGIASTAGSWTDADSLTYGLQDPECRQSCADYLAKLGR